MNFAGWLVLLSIGQEPSLKSVTPVPGGLEIVLDSPTPGYQVQFHPIIEKGPDGVERRRMVIRFTVEGAPNPPPPGPNPPNPPNPPGPQPEPPLPPGRFGLSTIARDGASELVKLPPESRMRSAKALAASFSSLSAAIRAGAMSLPREILAKTREGNNAALEALGPEFIEAWKPWGSRLAEKLEAIHSTGVLKTAADFADAWDEIVLGLGAVRSEVNAANSNP